MKQRKDFQDYLNGRDGVAEIFYVEDNSSSGFPVLGVEKDGIISYFYPDFTNGMRGLVILYCDFMSPIFKQLYELSQPRIETLAEHCPLLVQSVKDGADSRFDRGGIVNIKGKYAIVKWRTMDVKKYLAGKMDFSFMYDSLQVNMIVELMQRCTQMMQEIEKWDGFTTLEEIKIVAKEALPGAKIGLKIGSIFGGL